MGWGLSCVFTSLIKHAFGTNEFFQLAGVPQQFLDFF